MRAGRYRDPAGQPQSPRVAPSDYQRRFNNRDATAHAARRAALRRRLFSRGPQRRAGGMPQRESDADALARRARPLAISREGRGPSGAWPIGAGPIGEGREQSQPPHSTPCGPPSRPARLGAALGTGSCFPRA
ncbi:uncharacterized protein RHO17_013109 isoform 1-T3 [Thomomys bottae]